MKIAPVASAKPARPISNMQIDYCSDECEFRAKDPAGGLNVFSLLIVFLIARVAVFGVLEKMVANVN